MVPVSANFYMRALWRGVGGHCKQVDRAFSSKCPRCGSAAVPACRPHGTLTGLASPGASNPSPFSRGTCAQFGTGCSAQRSRSTEKQGGTPLAVTSPRPATSDVQRPNSSGTVVTEHAQRGALSGVNDAAEEEPASTSGGTTSEGGHRMSPLNIQMLSKTLHRQIFGDKEPQIPEFAVRMARDHLAAQGLGQAGSSVRPDVDLQLPLLRGKNIDEHFRIIARAQSQAYLEQATKLARCVLPCMPTKWQLTAGWTRYEEGREPMRVSHPDENALVLDVEVCVTESPRPILASAVSEKHWYSWVSERLVASDEDHYARQEESGLHDLIPLETLRGSTEPEGGAGAWQKRLVVGHNVSYDRARIKEQYLVKGPRTKFLDTMSLHTCVAGQTTAQKILWHHYMGKQSVSEGHRDWMGMSSPSSLVDVHWLYVSGRQGGRVLSKAKRDVFVKGTVADVREDFQSMMGYCAEDVLHTHEVLREVLPLFLERCPHPVTLAGLLEMGGAYLPVDRSWSRYLADCKYTFEDMDWEMRSKLMALADAACANMHMERYTKNPWLVNLDWTTKHVRGGSAKKKSHSKALAQIEEHYQRKQEVFQSGGREGVAEEEGDEEEEENCQFIIGSVEGVTGKRPIHMPGYPEWYRSLCPRRWTAEWQPGCSNISPQVRVVPYLLQMKWKGHPLHHHPHLGWGYIVSPSLRPGEVPIWGEEEDEEGGLQPAPEADLSAYITEDALLVEDRNEPLEAWPDQDVGGDTPSQGAVLEEQAVPSGKRSRHSAKVAGTDSSSNPQLKGKPSRLGRKKKEPVELSFDDRPATPEPKEDWRPRRETTNHGTTDDVVTLGNGECYYFFKLPHKLGSNANCGNPLSKDYQSKMENGTLTSAAGLVGQRILTLNSMVSFWRSARNRILEQFVVRVDKDSDSDADSAVGAIVPLVKVAGTATRRAVEPTWLTASNAKDSRVGSELKAMVRAPPGYHLVGADVDSQELWIASILGDMHFAGIHGCTAIGWMTLQGSKAAGTDVHSKTAKTIGISRDHAKVLNYGRFYGAGKPFIELLLKQFNPSLSDQEVAEKAETLYAITKGTRKPRLSAEGMCQAVKYGIPFGEDGLIEVDDYKNLKSLLNSKKDQVLLVGRPWSGGSESYLFNKLEEIAHSYRACTPVLGCRLTRALEKEFTGREFMPSKVNWVVQSSAVDYLHLLLVCMRWLQDLYNIDGRFCISIHDEVRYLIRSEDRYRAALALQITNLFTRAMFAHKLNMNDLPQSVAFFSAVDIDRVLRKEATMDCRTPSNPHGLHMGHNIPFGEVLDIYEVIEKTGGSLTKP